SNLPALAGAPRRPRIESPRASASLLWLLPAPFPLVLPLRLPGPTGPGRAHRPASHLLNFFLSGLTADCDFEGAGGVGLIPLTTCFLLFSPPVTVFGGTTMLSVSSLVRALFGSPVRQKRPASVRASLAVESLEGRALLNGTPLLPGVHHAGEV